MVQSVWEVSPQYMAGITSSGTNGFVFGFEPLLENNLVEGGERGRKGEKEGKTRAKRPQAGFEPASAAEATEPV